MDSDQGKLALLSSFWADSCGLLKAGTWQEVTNPSLYKNMSIVQLICQNCETQIPGTRALGDGVSAAAGLASTMAS